MEVKGEEPESSPGKVEQKTAPSSPTTRKRKRSNPTPSPSPTKRTPTSTRKSKKAATASDTLKKSAQVEAPTHILVIDNGGDTVKFGWANQGVEKNECSYPHSMPNVTARLPQQWTVLVGDQLDEMVQNRNQLIGVTHSVERGMITNLGNQVQVWKRILDKLFVMVPLQTETAKAFGWKNPAAAGSAAQKKRGKANTETATAPTNKTMIHPQTCAVLLALPPYCPRVLLDAITTVWMQDFGFSRVGFCVSSVCAATAAANRHVLGTTCLVDLGWSATHVVPVYQEEVLMEESASSSSSSSSKSATSTSTTAIRRMPLGGRHLINMWKYYVSYRQWNLMDQDWILRDVMHKTAYLSLNFQDDMNLALQKPAGRRQFDREFVLPDFQTTFEGRVQLPPVLQREMEQHEQDGESEDDEDMKEEDMVAAGEDDDDSGGDTEDNGGSDDEEEETIEQKRQRLYKQRREEERRQREMEAEQQVLNISVERFSVPEVLFRPSDGGLPLEWAGLAETIAQSVQACPTYMQPALYRSIRLVGGLTRLENLPKRLEMELRTLIPCKYELHISVSESPLCEAWHGARKLATQTPPTKWSVSRQEWESSPRGVWRRLLASEGGAIV